MPIAVVFNGCTQNKRFGAVFCVGATFVGLVVNQSFHADGDKRMTIIVVLFIDVCMRHQVLMCPRLSKKEEQGEWAWMTPIR